MKNFSSYRAHKVKLLTSNAKNHNKSAILNFFSAIIELVQELLISNMHNKFEEDMWKTFQVITHTRSNYWRKISKIIDKWFFALTRKRDAGRNPGIWLKSPFPYRQGIKVIPRLPRTVKLEGGLWCNPGSLVGIPSVWRIFLSKAYLGIPLEGGGGESFILHTHTSLVGV